MVRRCYLVSRPLDKNQKTGEGDLRWRAIGNGREVPRLDQEPRFREHWALCVLAGECDVRPSEPSSRQAFLDADYFDLGSNLASDSTTFRLISDSASSVSFVHTTTKWPARLVVDISALVEIGVTTRDNDWLLDKGTSEQCEVRGRLFS